MLAQQLRTDQERTRFLLAAIFSGIVWTALVVGTLGIGLLYIGLGAVSVLIAHSLFMAHVMGNGVRLSREQLPELYEKVERAARILGLTSVPEVYVMESGGLLNAFATKILSRRFVILYSNLLDACEGAGDQTGVGELDFIIGHELGHLGAGHLNWNAFLIPAHLMPWLGPAYSRAREYTCDACGHAVTQDLEKSSRALAILAAGGKYAPRVNLGAFVAQRREAASFWMAVYELNASHPFLSKRVAALRERVQPGSARPEPRGALAYLTAPMFGLYAGGAAAAPLMAIAVLGMLAAVALPAFATYRQRAQLGSSPFGDTLGQDSALQGSADDLSGSAEEGLGEAADGEGDVEPAVQGKAYDFAPLVQGVCEKPYIRFEEICVRTEVFELYGNSLSKRIEEYRKGAAPTLIDVKE